MITALVTLYNPTHENIDNICWLAEQADRIFACDNSAKNNESLFVVCPDNVIYIPYKNNLGLPKAFNRVLKDDKYWKDNKEDEDWVIFFDQDSKVVEGHIGELVKEFKKIREKNIPVGSIGPAYFDTSSGRVEIPKTKIRITDSAYVVRSIITSSMLTTYSTLKEVGFWNEDLFLDMADWDLCWRLQQLGKKSCLTTAVTLHHSLGLGRKKIGPITLKIAHPIREYYQIRDCMYLLRENYVPAKYKIRFLLMIYVRSYLHVKFLDHGEERHMYIERAKKDFKKGIRGEYQNNVNQANR